VGEHFPPFFQFLSLGLLPTWCGPPPGFTRVLGPPQNQPSFPGLPPSPVLPFTSLPRSRRAPASSPPSENRIFFICPPLTYCHLPPFERDPGGESAPLAASFFPLFGNSGSLDFCLACPLSQHPLKGFLPPPSLFLFSGSTLGQPTWCFFFRTHPQWARSLPFRAFLPSILNCALQLHLEHCKASHVSLSFFNLLEAQRIFLSLFFLFFLLFVIPCRRPFYPSWRSFYWVILRIVFFCPPIRVCLFPCMTLTSALTCVFSPFTFWLWRACLEFFFFCAFLRACLPCARGDLPALLVSILFTTLRHQVFLSTLLPCP